MASAKSNTKTSFKTSVKTSEETSVNTSEKISARAETIVNAKTSAKSSGKTVARGGLVMVLILVEISAKSTLQSGIPDTRANTRVDGEDVYSNNRETGVKTVNKCNTTKTMFIDKN